MLTITIPSIELFNEETLEFITPPPKTISLEHSLLSISKWEQKWHKPFLTTTDKTKEQIMDYVKCMTITQNVSEETYVSIIFNKDIYEEIEKYINDPSTATTISNDDGGKTYGVKGIGKVVTSEVIYAQMIELGIPWEAEKWHINRLIMLISVCKKRGTASKKMSSAEAMQRHIATNAARRKH